MATRQEVQERKAALKRALRTRCRDGALRLGTLAPSKRQLADEFGVSATVAGQAMQELIEECLFHTVPRSGTYVGALRPLVRERYVLLADCNETASPLRSGFDDRIASLGGAVLTVFPPQLAAFRHAGSFPNAAGVLEWGEMLGAAHWEELCGRVPARACYATLENEAGERDSVAFDDFDGGRQATEHLLHLGHRTIGFLGLHAPTMNTGPAWSRLREDGWRAALGTVGARDDLSAHATRETASISHPDQVEAARAGARELLRGGVDAVVAANDRAAQALLEELRASGVATSRWPAIVSFDNDSDLQSEALTSLRLPWETIGHAAADLLWERSHGQLLATPQHRLVKMRLIPRLTCQPNWTHAGLDSALMDHLVPFAPSR